MFFLFIKSSVTTPDYKRFGSTRGNNLFSFLRSGNKKREVRHLSSNISKNWTEDDEQSFWSDIGFPLPTLAYAAHTLSKNK